MAFYPIAVALCLLAAAVLTRQVWWPLVVRPSLTDEVRGLARQQEQLKQLHASGTLNDEQFAQSQATLERKLLDAMAAAPGGAVPAGPSAPSVRLSALLAGFVFVVAGGGYALIGTPNHLGLGPGAASSLAGAAGDATAGGATAAGEAQEGASAPHAVTPEQIQAMVDQLVAHLKAEPDDARGWQMLARTYVVLGKHAQAVDPFRQALRLNPDDPELLCDFADALAMANNRTLAGEPTALVERALKADPRNPKALALAGTAAFDRHDYKGAVAFWETLVQVEGTDAGFAQQIQGSIAEARQLAGMPPAAAASAAAPGLAWAGTPDAAPASARAAEGVAVASAEVSGTVTLAPALSARVAPDDTVFVFARAVDGPRMPLGIVRKKVRDLPLQFTLDDSMAMSPDAKLSSAARVVVGARVSKSGNAMPQNGDLQGLTGAVPVGARGLKIEINEEVAR